MLPASRTTLPSPADLAPPGAQRALDVPGTQLGLDGRGYGPAGGLPGDVGGSVGVEARSAEPILGPYKRSFASAAEVAEGDRPEPGPVGARPLRGQLSLDLADTEAIPQLGLWDRHDRAHALLPYESNQAKCHRYPLKNRPLAGYRTQRGAWSWSGFVVCDKWSCPKCGTRRARDTAATLGVAVERWLSSSRNHDVWMLTLTLPHVADDAMADVTKKLYDAHGRFLRSPAWRAFVERFGIVADVRVIDAAFGGRNGAHPHFHIALFPSAAITTDELPLSVPEGGDWFAAIAQRAAAAAAADPEGIRRRRDLDGERPAHLEVDPNSTEMRRLSDLDQHQRQLVLDGWHQLIWPAWRAALIAAGVTRGIGGSALKLTPAEGAADYFTAWGLADEVGATPSKIRSHLRLLDAYAVGHDDAGAEYLDWCEAMHGRQWVTGLADLRRRFTITADDVTAYVRELQRKRDVAAAERGEPVRLVRELYVVIPPLLLPAALSLGWGRVTAFLDGDDAGDAQDALISLLRAESLRLDLLRTQRRARALANAPPAG